MIVSTSNNNQNNPSFVYNISDSTSASKEKASALLEGAKQPPQPGTAAAAAAAEVAAIDAPAANFNLNDFARMNYYGRRVFFLRGKKSFGVQGKKQLGAFFGLFLPMVLFVIYEINYPRGICAETSVFSCEAWLTVIILNAIACFSLFIRSSMNDPGFIAIPLTQQLRRALPATQEKNKNTYDLRWCSTCRIFRPLRCHHCKVCDLCVIERDHHCPFLNNCIGRKNRRSYLYFVLTAIIMQFLILAEVITQIVHPLSLGVDAVILIERVSFDLAIIQGIYALLLCSNLMSLFAFQARLAMRNWTTDEHRRIVAKNPLKQDIKMNKDFDYGTLKNVQAVFLCPPPAEPIYMHFEQLSDQFLKRRYFHIQSKQAAKSPLEKSMVTQSPLLLHHQPTELRLNITNNDSMLPFGEEQFSPNKTMFSPNEKRHLTSAIYNPSDLNKKSRNNSFRFDEKIIAANRLHSSHGQQQQSYYYDKSKSKKSDDPTSASGQKLSVMAQHLFANRQRNLKEQDQNQIENQSQLILSNNQSFSIQQETIFSAMSRRETGAYLFMQSSQAAAAAAVAASGRGGGGSGVGPTNGNYLTDSMLDQSAESSYFQQLQSSKLNDSNFYSLNLRTDTEAEREKNMKQLQLLSNANKSQLMMESHALYQGHLKNFTDLSPSNNEIKQEQYLSEEQSNENQDYNERRKRRAKTTLLFNRGQQNQERKGSKQNDGN